MKKLLIAGLCLFYSQVSLGMLTGEALETQAFNCGQTGNLEVGEAMRYIQDSFVGITNSALDLTGAPRLSEADISSMQAKLGQIEVECSTQNACAESRVGGYHSSDQPNKVYICYHNIQSIDQQRGAFCQMLGTLFHEMAHAADIEMDPNHNHGPNTDKVYQLGNAATTFCLQNPHWYNEVNSRLPRSLASIEATERFEAQKTGLDAARIMGREGSDSERF